MDRKLLLGLVLIFVIVAAPTFFLTRPQPRKTPTTAVSDSTTLAAPAAMTASTDTLRAAPATTSAAPVGPETIIPIRSALYRYGVSTRGARIVSSRFLTYKSMADGDHDDTLELVAPGDGLLGGILVNGRDTLHLDQMMFTPSSDSVTVTSAPASLTLHGESGAYAIDLTYTFEPRDYRIVATGTVRGIDPAGGLFLFGLGNGFRNTESVATDNWAQSGIVTKLDKTSLLRFSQLKARETRTLSGPFEWVAVKSKYFVAAFFAYDSTALHSVGRIGGVQAVVADTQKTPVRAHVMASLPVAASGHFDFSLYIGPMEYDRLSRMGHDFDDVNPYGWSWIRWLVRPIAVWIRAIFVWMHTALGLGYGLVIVVFGLAVRILLWPLNRIAMRSMAKMQALQPELTAIQARFKDDPAGQQQATMRLYKEHGANPFGGCWPMLLPYPLLVAVFFVLAYTIEVRGVHFLWIHDLARPDPLYIIPVVMAISMYFVSKVSQIGLPPNPQTKMMTTITPVMMLVIFARFAAGLNLYYTVQNLASIPQQWLVVRERMKMQGKAIVGKKK